MSVIHIMINYASHTCIFKRYNGYYELTSATDTAKVVLYIDVSNDGPFRHVDDELTVAGLCRIKLDFEDGQHISRSSFTDDVVDSIHCLRIGVRHKIDRHMEYRWH